MLYFAQCPGRAFFMENQLSVLVSKILKSIILWAKESYIKSLLVITIAVVAGIPLIEYLQTLIKSLPYLQAIQMAISFLQNNFTIADYLLYFSIIILSFITLTIYRQVLKTRIISEKFNSNLSNWSIPVEAGWTIQTCMDALGKMLCINNSPYPGTLKESYGWYDYEVTFLVKFDEKSDKSTDNFSITVRAENNHNGIVFRVSKTHFSPYLLNNGTYIFDNESHQQLPTVLSNQDWIPIKISVKGNNAEIWIYNFKIQYKIPTLVCSVENQLLSEINLTMDRIKSSRDKVSTETNKIIEKISQKFGLKEEIKKNQLQSEIDELIKNMTPSTKIVLDYQKGSIGFGEANNTRTYYRNLIVKKI